MEDKRVDSRLGRVRLGPDCEIEPEALVGYLSPRSGVSDELVIGKGARVRSGSVIYAGSTIGAGLETGHNVVIREQNEIGDDLSIWNNSVIDYGCNIGVGVKIHCNIYIAQFTVIEDGARRHYRQRYSSRMSGIRRMHEGTGPEEGLPARR